MATLLLNCGLKRKSLNDDDCISKTHLVLQESDCMSSSSDIESIYSVQSNETAEAHDTSDTSDHHEFEVKSSSEVTLSEISSEPESSVNGNCSAVVDGFGSEISYIADLSETTFSSDENSVERSSCKRCEKCKELTPFTLCLKCFRQRRIYLPSRPRGKRRKNRGSSPKRGDSCSGPRPSQESLQGSLGNQGSLVGSNELDNNAPVQETSQGDSCSGPCPSQGSFQGSLVGSSQGDDNAPVQKASEGSGQEPKICQGCSANPVDGGFIHKNTVHTMYCYKCSMKEWRMRGTCPYCKQKVSKVAKIFPVEELVFLPDTLSVDKVSGFR